jgi:hypothetical protein
MRRLTASLLLLFALLGNFVPAALAAIPATTPKCCLRKNVHHCHNSAAAAEGELAFTSTSCCSHDCCRAATPVQWAHPEAANRVSSAQPVEIYFAQIHPTNLSREAPVFFSTRAPPRVSIL